MVGFRFFTINRANRYRLTGWVKNLYDGRVEIKAEGKKQDLIMFLDDIKIGPPSAHVSNVAEKWTEISESKHQGFDLIY